ncbi:unnamed protein product [Nezara viridula]|uniref:Uncharacterized protein n=1 Tax=Nezara viridula TaxID=85310 RepID=A0A9P0HET8_NEZVI|nr:unnamed protein product [Nezara viridula]
MFRFLRHSLGKIACVSGGDCRAKVFPEQLVDLHSIFHEKVESSGGTHRAEIGLKRTKLEVMRRVRIWEKKSGSRQSFVDEPLLLTVPRILCQIAVQVCCLSGLSSYHHPTTNWCRKRVNDI